MGQEAVPLERHPAGAPAIAPPEATSKPVSLHLSLEYDQVGSPSTEGIRLEELGDLTGQPVAIGVLDEGAITTIHQAQIESLLVQMEAKGIAPYLDGQPLPYISWGDEHLLNLIDLLQAVGASNPALGDPALLDTLRSAVPGMREADIQFSAQFSTQP
jgi:hypothetical protein